MITASIAQPPPDKTGPMRTNPPVFARSGNLASFESHQHPRSVYPATIVPTAKTIHSSEFDEHNDEREIFFLILTMALVLIVPALLMALYLIFNPDAFTNDITPKYDFSSWQLGERPSPIQP